MNRTISRLSFPVSALLVYLAAITIFGKGPTYLGVPPIYWGELILLLLIAWLGFRLLCGRRIPVEPPLGLLVIGYMILGATLTLRDLPVYGLDALRDAAMWYYAGFYFAGLYIARATRAGERMWAALKLVWLLALGWNILTGPFPGLIEDLSPTVTSRGVPLLGGSGSENFMHLALGAILVMIGELLHTRGRLGRLFSYSVVLLAAALLFFAAEGRGVKIAVVGALAAGFLAAWNTPIAPALPHRLIKSGVIAGWSICIFLLFVEASSLTNLGHMDRFLELFAGESSGTAYWRSLWWSNLWASVHQNNPLLGLGFGLNLGLENPLLGADLSSEWPVRSPHNFNMTVFARMGYAGLSLWLLILCAGLGGLFLRVRKGGLGRQAYSPSRHRELVFWLMMLVATWLNSSFGVLMEGPVLGVWFWFALGFATGRAKTPMVWQKERGGRRMSIKDKAPEKSCDVLLVGQVPPPFHGQAISIQRMLDGRYSRLRFFHVPMRFSREIGEVGRFGLRKLWHLLTVLCSIVRMRSGRHITILFYQAAGGDRVPLYRDLAILCLTRRLFKKTAFFIHANGLTGSYRNLPPGLRPLFRRSYFGADLVLVPSENAGKEMETLLPKRCVVVPHGIQDLYPTYRPSGRRTGGKVVLMFVGVVRKSKGILVLLEACRKLKERGRDFALRVIGDFESPSFRSRFFSLSHEAGLATVTDWRGSLAGDPKWEAYASADIVCAPSLSESFGLVVLEAMQFALPVVATPAGSAPTMIEEGRSGFLVPFNDSQALADRLTALIDDPGLRERLGKRGREVYLERFTAERFWRNLEEALLAIA